MTKKTISDAVSNISTRHIEEAADYSAKKKSHKPVWTKLGAAAAFLALVLTIGSILVPFNGSIVVSAYSYETNEEITAAGSVIDTGTIRDSGEMTGHPLMFYLFGEDIETVRFSCKNQQINFIDWTEKRDEYGNAQNFTVTYGEDESEYYYLTIDWVPNATIRELTDNAETTIANLPTEMREDIIVMEITFANGKIATKAITISLLDNGTFFAAFNDYEINETDTFINRSDSKAIPRDILYSDDSEVGTGFDKNPNGYSPLTNQQTPDEKVKVQDPADSIVFTGTITENLIENTISVILVDVDDNSKLSYDKVAFELTEEQKDWETKIGEQVQIVCSDIFQEELPPFGKLISIKTLENAKTVAKAYYENTVFEIISMELKAQTTDEISFSVSVSKGGVVQEPNRTIWLQLVSGSWEVVNEGY